MKVVAFNGSPRKKGNTAILLNTVLEECRSAGCETELVQVGGNLLRGCTACGTCKERGDARCKYDDDIVNGCIEKMVAADAIVLGSPTYFSDLTSETKALIDRAGYAVRGGGNPLRRKVGAAVASVRRAGSIHVLDSINHFFSISEMIIPGSSYWNLGVGRERGDVASDEEGMKTMRNLGINIAWLLEKIHGG